MWWRQRSKEVSFNSIATVRERVCSDVIDGQTIILDMRSGRYLGLDRVGGNIWSLVLLGKRLREIIDVLAQEYEVDKARVSEDVIRFVTDLKKRGLVELR